MNLRHCSFALCLPFLAGTALAQGQDDVPLDLDPGADAPPVIRSTPQPTQRDQANIIVNVPGTPGAVDPNEAKPSAEESGFYHYEGGLSDRRDRYGDLRGGPVPETHVVREGDSLWYLSAFYFNNAWEWPRIWSYNPTITNPHFIYPGDIVRLYPRGAGPIAQKVATPEPVARSVNAPKRRGFSLRQIAFVDIKKLKKAPEVTGATNAHLLLAEGDSIYLKYKDDKKPKVGESYTVYREIEKVKDPSGKSDKSIGSYVKIVGEVKVRSVKKNKRARATVLRSVDPIERGMKVGLLRNTVKEIFPVANEQDLQGRVVSELRNLSLIGERQVVLIGLGSKQGVKKGNRLYVVRRGDARVEVAATNTTIGQNDKRYPARAVGEIIVADVGKNVSLCLVTLAERAIGAGDFVLMRKDRR